MEFTAAVTQEGDWFVARCLEVEVASQGSSHEQAVENLKEAVSLLLEDEGEPPRFANPVVTTFQLTA